MLTITNQKLSQNDRQRHETIVALEESEGTLRKKRMWVSFQLFGLMIAGVAISVLTYNLWTGGPGQLIEVLPETAGTALLCLVVFTLLSGRAAKRDMNVLMDMKAESRRALAAEDAETARLDLDRDTVVVRHGERMWLVTAVKPGGAAVVELSADPTLGDMFSQPSPPLRHVSWLQDPATGAISHAMQQGLPPGGLDRIEIPATVDDTRLRKALGVSTEKPVTTIKATPDDLRTAIAELIPE
ncbi:MAG: hypothetical protein AAGD23_02475 [Pseudomonadota bacterium]